MGIMSFIRKKSRTLASGEIRNYFYEVESYWENGKSKQRVVKYLGTSPFPNKIEIEPEVAKQVAHALFNERLPLDELKERLKAIGVTLPEGEIKKISLDFFPPLKKYFIRFD